MQGRLSEGSHEPNLILLPDLFLLNSSPYNLGGRGPGVSPLDGGERLLGGLRQGQTGDGLSRGGKVTFTMQKTSHSVWRDTWIAGYIDQVKLFTSLFALVAL